MQIDSNSPDPSIPPSDGRCRLLALAPELRNEIYEYALSHDDGVLVLPSREGFKLHVFCKLYDFEANQIKYVSRQLRTETHGMLVRLNDVVFQTSRMENSNYDSKDPGLALAERFLQQSPPTLRSQLRKIIIYHRFVASNTGNYGGVEEIRNAISDSTQLSKFCRKNPQITVLIRFSWQFVEQSGPSDWIGCHYIFHEKLHAETPFMKTSERIEQKYRGVRFLVGGRLDGVHRPPNFRLTLTHNYPLSHAIMEGYIARDPGVFEKEEVEDILAASRKMYEEGI